MKTKLLALSALAVATLGLASPAEAATRIVVVNGVPYYQNYYQPVYPAYRPSYWFGPGYRHWYAPRVVRYDRHHKHKHKHNNHKRRKHDHDNHHRDGRRHR